MTRAVTMLTMFLTFFAFANMGGAGAMERVQGPMMHASSAVVPLPSQHDRCQIAAACSLSCVLCAAGMLTKSANLAHSTARGVDLHRTLERRMMSARLYRPPKA